jgi:hypothetical protein
MREKQNACQNHKQQQQLEADEEKVLKNDGRTGIFSRFFFFLLLLLPYPNIIIIIIRLRCHLAHHQCHVGVCIFMYVLT